MTTACSSSAAPSRRASQRGTVFVYHATERTIRHSEVAAARQAGRHEQLDDPRPAQAGADGGGYAQFTYAFNYWGPTGVNRDTHVFVRRVENVEF
jgi:nitrate reductase / nitrite oxidoreductase, alpha subunit